MCPEELVLLVSTLAISIAKDKTNDELDLLSTIFSQLGDTLATISVARQCNEDSDNNQTNAII